MVIDPHSKCTSDYSAYKQAYELSLLVRTRIIGSMKDGVGRKSYLGRSHTSCRTVKDNIHFDGRCTQYQRHHRMCHCPLLPPKRPFVLLSFFAGYECQTCIFLLMWHDHFALYVITEVGGFCGNCGPEMLAA